MSLTTDVTTAVKNIVTEVKVLLTTHPFLVGLGSGVVLSPVVKEVLHVLVKGLQATL